MFEENLSVNGGRKIWLQMRREGFELARFTVARLMTDIAIESIVLSKTCKTTHPRLSDALSIVEGEPALRRVRDL
ncbi:hypothetical protein [Sagittula marina]|uniref:hypothetical protein n=1 Tax=Sagittula marina TaxID=943940 RepID=UPI0031E2277D